MNIWSVAQPMPRLCASVDKLDIGSYRRKKDFLLPSRSKVEIVAGVRDFLDRP